LSGAETIGLDAQQFTLSTKEGGELQIVFAKFDSQSQAAMNMSDAELINYAKTSFLGSGKPAQSNKERIILGLPSIGEIISSKIPVPSTIEIHLFSCSSQTKYVLGFKADIGMDAAKLDKTIVEITGSLTTT